MQIYIESVFSRLAFRVAHSFRVSGCLGIAAIAAVGLLTGCHHADEPEEHRHITFDSVFRTHPADSLSGDITISGDGNRVAAEATNQAADPTGQSIYIFNANTGAVINRIVPGTWVSKLQFNRSGSRLLVSSHGKDFGRVTIFDASSGNVIQSIRGIDTVRIHWSALSPTGDSLFLGFGGYYATSELRIYSVSSGALLRTYPNAEPIGLADGGKSVVMRTFGISGLCLMDLASGTKTTSYSYNATVGAYYLYTSTDGALVGLADSPGSRSSAGLPAMSLPVIDTKTGAQIGSPTIDWFAAFALSNDHSTMAFSNPGNNNGTKNFTVSELNIARGAPTRTIGSLTSTWYGQVGLAYSDDASRLVGACYGQARIWQVK